MTKMVIPQVASGSNVPPNKLGNRLVVVLTFSFGVFAWAGALHEIFYAHFQRGSTRRPWGLLVELASYFIVRALQFLGNAMLVFGRCGENVICGRLDG